MRAEALKTEKAAGAGASPLCEAEVWTEAGREAQRIFPLPPSHTSTEPCITSLAENKLERFVRCLGIVRSGPAPC